MIDAAAIGYIVGLGTERAAYIMSAIIPIARA